MSTREKIEGYFEGLNQKLFDALPQAERILELGCANGRLGHAYKQRYPSAHWTGIDNFEGAIAQAKSVLDSAYYKDLDSDNLGDLSSNYDLIVFGDLIEHIKDPLALLLNLRRLVRPNGKLVCCIPNMAHHSVITRVLLGDFSYDRNGLLDETHLRLYSPASAIKLLLDAAWFPNIADSYVVGGHRDLVSELVRLSTKLGSSVEAAERNLSTYQMIIDATPISARERSVSPPSISVVVPVSSPLQFDLNVGRSPGLSEIGAEIVPVANARSAAEALTAGKARSQGRWILFCHQDVYFPAGAGFALQSKLSSVPSDSMSTALFGFVGLTESEHHSFMGSHGYRLTGQIVDRTTRIDEAHSGAVASLDECAVLLSRDSIYKAEPSLGWHLWATDLAWQARGLKGVGAEILNVPVFHNSLTGHSVPESFQSSLRVLAHKYSEQSQFVTLCGTWRRARSTTVC